MNNSIDINNLTIGQAKELASIFGGSATQHNVNESMLNRYVGKYVIVRSRNEGVNAGIVDEIDTTGVILKQARRIWYHKPKSKNECWYEGVANTGLSDDSKISSPVTEKAIIEDYSITLCSEEGAKEISSHKSHAQ